MKKFFKVIVVAIMTCSVLLGAFGCKNDKETEYIEITTREELYAMESNKSYRLACDIDLAGREWIPLNVQEFDGNGFTIKDAVIRTGSNIYVDRLGMAFFCEVKALKNITFEKITVIASGANFVAVALCKASERIENITVQDCQITADNYDITGEKKNQTFAVGGLIAEGNIVATCSVKDCTIKVVTSNIKSKIGGMCGNANYGRFSNCIVQGCEMEIERIDNIAVGGLTAGCVGEINSCIVEDCDLNISDCGNCTAGGIASLTDKYNSTEVCNSKSIMNTIKITANNSYVCGGLFDEISNSAKDCLSSGNNIKATCSGEGNKIASGGFGRGKNPVNIQKCVVQNCTISSDGRSVGFIGNDAGSIVFSLVKGNELRGSETDEFALQRDNIRNSYVFTKENCKNVNQLAELNLEQWLRVIDVLNLDEALWGINNDGDLTLKN